MPPTFVHCTGDGPSPVGPDDEGCEHLEIASGHWPMVTAPRRAGGSARRGWIRAAARANPMYYVVTAERALFAGGFPAVDVAVGAAAALAAAVVGLLVGARVMRRASA